MNAIDRAKTAPLRQVQNVKELLLNDNAKAQLASVAAKHMNPERMMRVVANAIRTTPKLQECDPMSFLGALMYCASLGLEPQTSLGHAYLIPFENKRKGITEVQVVVGYKGFIDLARRSGQLATIHGDVVYDDDEVFSHEYGSNQHLRHRPGPRKGRRLGAYCYVRLNLGDGITAEGHRYMTMDEIIKHRDTYSQGWKTAVRFGKTADSPWNEANPAFESMAIKTAVRALANRGELPMSIEFMDAMQADEQKADYGRYAFDPTAGLTPQIDSGAGDGDEPPAPAQIEQGVTIDMPVAAPRKRAEKVERVSATADADLQADAEFLNGPATPASAPHTAEAARKPDQGQFGRLVDMMLADLADGASPEEIEDIYGAQIEQIRAVTPDLYGRLQDALTEARERELG